MCHLLISSWPWMRDQNLELEVRVTAADAALPFFQAKPKEPRVIKTAAKEYVASANGVNFTGPKSTRNAEARKIIAPPPREGVNGADFSPLEFLLGQGMNGVPTGASSMGSFCQNCTLC